MGFLEADFDLQYSSWTSNDLDRARNRLEWIYRLLHKDAWNGYLQVHLDSDTVPSMGLCIHVVQQIVEAGRISDSIDEQILAAKVRGLFTAGDEQVFYDRLFEFEVFAWLGVTYPNAGLRWEPTSGGRRNTDFKLQFDSETVYIECTRLRIEALNSWIAVSEQLRSSIETTAAKHGLKVLLEGRLPLGLIPGDVSAFTSKTLMREIKTNSSGEIEIPTTGGIATLRWRPMPTYDSSDAGFRSNENVFFVPDGAEFMTISATTLSLYEEDYDACATRAVRNTLKAKRKQFQLDSPYILALGLGYESGRRNDVWARVLPALQSELPRNDHAWISAVVSVFPSHTFESGRPPGSVDLVVCDNTPKHPLSPEILSPFGT